MSDFATHTYERSIDYDDSVNGVHSGRVISQRRNAMLKLNVVEKVYYRFDRETCLLERQPHKVFSISLSQTEGASNVRQALDDVITDLASIANKLNMRE